MVLTQERNDILDSFSSRGNLEQFIGETVKRAIRDEIPATRSLNNRSNETVNTNFLPDTVKSNAALTRTSHSRGNSIVPLHSAGQSFTQMNAVLTAIEESPIVRKRKVDPLVFDLVGNGEIKTTAMKKVFNITGQGTSITGWVDKGMGLLAFDIDNDNSQGKDGRSLLGNFTPINGKTYSNGFEALKALAKRHIMLFNKSKLELADIKNLEKKAGLCMLVDGRKLSLSEDLNITEISLEYEELGRNPDQFGNQHRQRSWFVRNGQKYLVVDVWFKYTAPEDIPKGKDMIENIKEINFMKSIANALGY